MAEYTNKDFKEIWQKTLDLIQENHDFDSAIFNTWFNDSSLYDIDDEFAIIVVPYKINKQIMLENILVIQNRLSSVIGKDMQCQIFLKAEVDNLTPNSVVKRRNDELFENKIKPQYNFDSFIIGKSNRDAQAAALNCCYYPGNYNPLFIYGNSGLGKTHLLHSIGNYILENQPDKKVLYIYSEDFVTLLIDAMKNKSVEDRISEVDYLLIDDIQRLTQSASQEIFFNLYNKLVSNNKQIVITSDIHPSELRGIENRLISRFSSGLSITIGSPEFETAKAILRKKLEGRQDDVVIEDAVLDYIATRFSSDIRKLEGTLNELFFKAILYNPDTINLEFAKEIFKEDPSFVKSENITPSKV
ncbi:MAG: DnaA/Hda family protein, partial [Coprobacillus sp.]